MGELEQRQTRHKRKRKLRVGRVVSFILLLLLLVGGVYTVIQYMIGYNSAKGESVTSSEFTGDTLNDGDRENILVLGIDSRGEEQSRTDTMMLVSWNKENNDVKVISFMRDIYADIPGYQSYKLNTAYYLDGVQLVKDTISSMFDVPIHHYALIDFNSFETLVDIVAPNGVPINVEKDMSEKIGVTLTKGQQNLTGKELLGYARFRSDEEGDFGRVNRQQIVMEALQDEILSIGNLVNIPEFIGATEGYIETDLTKKDKIDRVIDAVTSGKLSMDKLTVPTEGTYSYSNYSHAGSVIEINSEENRAAIQEFLGK
jgi:LCP family protein required for cell wall assembly